MRHVIRLEKIAYVFGDVCIRRKRRKRQKLIVTELVFDYFENSTLHGLRYIAERGLNIIERLFWLITFVSSIAMCIYLIYNVYVKWQTSPVVVTVNGRLASVGTVPFPSVTICPAIKCKQSAYNYTDALAKIDRFIQNTYHNESLSDEFTTKFENVNVLCDFPQTSEKNTTSNYSSTLLKDITEVSLTLQEIFLDCKWYNKVVNCTDVFSKVYTEEGVCYTANGLAARDIFTDNIQTDYPYLESNHTIVEWSPETGQYTPNHSYDKKPYPRRGRVYGSDPDFRLILKMDPDSQDQQCNIMYSGFKIFLHHPMDFPTSSMYYYAALPDQTSSVAISFHQLNTDINMFNSTTYMYPADVRQCYFPSERLLRYFRIYTASNCRAECLSNYTYKTCKCVDFYMPHNDSSEICSRTMRHCVHDARDYMAEKERSAEISLEYNDEACRCLPACDNIEYDAEILKTHYDFTKGVKSFVKRNYETGVRDDVLYSRVELFFKKGHFVTMQRRELFGVIDFLANIGGLLGLFLGFSFISLVEVIYFMTLSLWSLELCLVDGNKLTSFYMVHKNHKNDWRSLKFTPSDRQAYLL